MADISLEAVTGKLNRVGYDAFMQALRLAKGAGNRNLELAHWLLKILQMDRTDLAMTADHFKLDRAVRVRLQVAIEEQSKAPVVCPPCYLAKSAPLEARPVAWLYVPKVFPPFVR